MDSAALVIFGAAVGTLITRHSSSSPKVRQEVRVGVSCLLLDPLTGKFVLGIRKHKSGITMGHDTWHNPGGKVDPGETLEQTCCRELAEETGMVVHPSSCVQIGTTNDILQRHFVTVHFLCEWDETLNNGNQPQLMEPDKCKGWSWVTWDHVLQLHRTQQLFLPLQHLIQRPHFQQPMGARQQRLRRHVQGKVIFLIGYPGSGKGTQGKTIAKQLNLHHVSTGELFRAEVKTGSAIGQQFDKYMQQGEIIPEDLTFDYLKQELSKSKYDQGFLLDGYPKDAACYAFITNLFQSQEHGKTMLAAVYFDIARQEVHRRLTGRLMCRRCEKNYHRHIKAVQPLVEGQCDLCLGPLAGRNDDKPATIDRRLDSYDAKTMPNVVSFQKEGLLLRVNAGNSPSTVNRDVLRLLERRCCPPRDSYFLNWHDDGGVGGGGGGGGGEGKARRSTKWHNHMDAESDVLLHALVAGVEAQYQTNGKGGVLDTVAQNKIYPISHLVLGPQTKSKTFESVYYRLPNFHPISAADDEAFTTGAMGSSLDYALTLATLEVCGRHVNQGVMTEIEEDLFEVEGHYDGGGGWVTAVTRDDGDSTTRVDWSLLPGWRDKMIHSVPEYELHHGIDVPKRNSEKGGGGSSLPPVDLNVLSAAMNGDARVGGMCTGGWFIFEKENRWAYRSNEFSNEDYATCQKRLLVQFEGVKQVFEELLAQGSGGDGGVRWTCKTSASLEKVHCIWRF